MINHANGEITNPFFLKSGTRWEVYSCYSAVLGDYFVPGTGASDFRATLCASRNEKTGAQRG